MKRVIFLLLTIVILTVDAGAFDLPEELEDALPETAEVFMKHLKLAAIETHVADARTCCLHPASATHRQMNEAELIAAGVPGDLVRLSVGLENWQDLADDIASALASI